MAERIEEGRNATDISALFSNLISNPEALSKMKEIISKIGAEENGNDSPPNENNLSNNENTTEESEQESFDKSITPPPFKILTYQVLCRKCLRFYQKSHRQRKKIHSQQSNKFHCFWPFAHIFPSTEESLLTRLSK